MPSEEKYIAIISNEPWAGLWYSKHYYAKELADLGHKVFFINPTPKWSPNHLFSSSVTEKQVQTNLYQVSYKQNLPLTSKFIFIKNISDKLISDKLEKYFTNHISENKEIIFWQFDPFRLIDILFTKLKYKRIYHVVDQYYTTNNTLLAQKASLIVTVNKGFFDYFSKIASNVINISHGISQVDTGYDEEIKQAIIEKFGLFSILIGTFNYDIDIPLIDRLTTEIPQKLLHIGTVDLKTSKEKDIFSKLIKKENFIHLDPVEPNYLRNYIAAAKVCIVPYKVSEKQFTRTPIKILNYLAQKKVIISTSIYNYSELLNKSIFEAKTHEQFISKTQDLLISETDQLDKIDNFIHKHMYKNLIDSILNKLDN